jgi:large subunit ribosomal protein L15
MDLSNLKPAKGSTKSKKRVGRGEGAGTGGTSTRGHNGAKSRSGYSRKIGFEGGQMPLQRRVPKFGFTNPNRVEYKGINLDTIQALIDTKKIKAVDKDVLVANGLCQKKELVKILGRGELTSKIDVLADAYSASAKTAIEGKGGKAELVPSIHGDKPEAKKAEKKAAPVAKKEVKETPKAESKEEASGEEE